MESTGAISQSLWTLFKLCHSLTGFTDHDLITVLISRRHLSETAREGTQPPYSPHKAGQLQMPSPRWFPQSEQRGPVSWQDSVPPARTGRAGRPQYTLRAVRSPPALVPFARRCTALGVPAGHNFGGPRWANLQGEARPHWDSDCVKWGSPWARSTLWGRPHKAGDEAFRAAPATSAFLGLGPPAGTRTSRDPTRPGFLSRVWLWRSSRVRKPPVAKPSPRLFHGSHGQHVKMKGVT